MPLSDKTREMLKGVSVATICTALYKRGLRNQFIQDVTPVSDAGTMVGEAFTLRYIPAREDLNELSVFRDPKHPQRDAVERCPPGSVMVIDSRKDARAASAGGILATRLMVRGCAGLVTDGGFRDSYEMAEMDMPIYHNRPSSPTNLTHHQAIDIDVFAAIGLQIIRGAGKGRLPVFHRQDQGVVIGAQQTQLPTPVAAIRRAIAGQLTQRVDDPGGEGRFFLAIEVPGFGVAAVGIVGGQCSAGDQHGDKQRADHLFTHFFEIAKGGMTS